MEWGKDTENEASNYLHFRDCITGNEFEASEVCCRQMGMVADLRTWQGWRETWMNSGGTLERERQDSVTDQMRGLQKEPARKALVLLRRQEMVLSPVRGFLVVDPIPKSRGEATWT